MSNNPYMDAFVRWFRKQDDDPGVDVELVAALAFIKELQTLNETLSSIDYSLNSLADEIIHRGVTVNQD